jgi:hypothetical protein
MRRLAERRRCLALRSFAETSLSVASPLAEGVGRGESRGGYWEGEPSESLNPLDGFGMKQGRADEGGKKRQEVEKT